MNRGGLAITTSAALGILGALLGPAPSAHADRSWHHWRERHREVRLVPRKTVRIIINGAGAHRDDRWPHQRVTGDCDVARHETVIIDGVTYHVYDGAYYKGGPATYTMVPVATVPVAMTASETIIVNVPNANGSYTPVTLQVADNGTYVGPQGEVYPTKPELSQLAAMYGK